MANRDEYKKVINEDEYKKEQEKQVEDNFSAFQKMLPNIIVKHRGKFALMKDGEIKGYFSSRDDAREAGRALYENRVFSIQHVTTQKADLGYYSCYAFV